MLYHRKLNGLMGLWYEKPYSNPFESRDGNNFPASSSLMGAPAPIPPIGLVAAALDGTLPVLTKTGTTV